MNSSYNKWVAMWGSAVSILENKPEAYAKNITLRYPIYCPFDGDSIRLTFDNYCGTEPISIEKVTVMQRIDDVGASTEYRFITASFENSGKVTIDAGCKAVSDDISISISRGETIYVSFFLKDFTQMRSSVYMQGPLSGGKYAIGDMTEVPEFDIDISRKTNIYYFLSNISIRTKECNKAVVCYGDSITAQDWPDYLVQKLDKAGIDNISIIRRATSGSRILRQYSCITYESYGLMGKNRFDHEVPTDGADMVIIQQGINDIIHPVGTDVNPFRPMSDLPTVEELEEGLDWYISEAKKLGYKVALGTLIPIEGWRTYADFREDMKNSFNDYMRSCSEVDGVIDFDKATRDEINPKAFAAGCDSGDHLHPSAKGYEVMAEEACKYLIQVYGN